MGGGLVLRPAHTISANNPRPERGLFIDGLATVHSEAAGPAGSDGPV